MIIINFFLKKIINDIIDAKERFMQIKVEKLKFSYQARLILSISEGAFESGHIYGIVGNNGVGKTTFSKL